MKTDVLIIGQGLAGTLLSYELLQRGLKVLVVDDDRPQTASKISSGVINPITGKKRLLTWLWDELLPAAKATYAAIEVLTGATLMREITIVDFFETSKDTLFFAQRSEEEEHYLHGPSQGLHYKELFNFNHGTGEIAPCFQIDVALLLDVWKQHLKKESAYKKAVFSLEDCIIKDETIQWKDVSADKIIFGQGAFDYENKWFRMLPFAGNKGEALLLDIPDLSTKRIYKNGFALCPWQDGLFWFGSTFKPLFKHLEPTVLFRENAEKILSDWLKLPFTIVDHLVAERPAAGGQRPFVGMHPVQQNVGIFNGLGAKGCSVGPYFAKQLAAHITNGTSIDPEASILRFDRMLRR